MYGRFIRAARWRRTVEHLSPSPTEVFHEIRRAVSDIRRTVAWVCCPHSISTKSKRRGDPGSSRYCDLRYGNVRGVSTKLGISSRRHFSRCDIRCHRLFRNIGSIPPHFEARVLTTFCNGPSSASEITSCFSNKNTQTHANRVLLYLTLRGIRGADWPKKSIAESRYYGVLRIKHWERRAASLRSRPTAQLSQK